MTGRDVDGLMCDMYGAKKKKKKKKKKESPFVFLAPCLGKTPSSHAL